jgi:D-alanine-D-alanine ligase
MEKVHRFKGRTLMSMKTIAIVAGGDSSEYGISLKSAAGLYSFIDKSNYKACIVILRDRDWSACPEGIDSTLRIPVDKNDFSYSYQGKKINFDLAWITIHGTPGENGLLQGYFDLIGLPYNCCGVLPAALTFNKYVCNRYLSQFGLRVAPSVLLRREDSIDASKILTETGLPCFVKSNVGGSSFGTSKVKKAAELPQAIELAFGEGNEVLVEGFLSGTELTNGCYKTTKGLVCLPLPKWSAKMNFSITKPNTIRTKPKKSLRPHIRKHARRNSADYCPYL